MAVLDPQERRAGKRATVLARLRSLQRAVSLCCPSAPGAVFASEAALTSSTHKILTTTGRTYVLTGPWAFLLQTQLLPIAEAHFNGKQLLLLTPLPGCCGKSCPDTHALHNHSRSIPLAGVVLLGKSTVSAPGSSGSFLPLKGKWRGVRLLLSPPTLAQQLFATCRNKPRGELKPSNERVTGGDTGGISHTAGRMCPAGEGEGKENWRKHPIKSWKKYKSALTSGEPLVYW